MAVDCRRLSLRLAEALDWPEADVCSLSLQSLRELVRPINPKLADEISVRIQCGTYLHAGN
jgi:hypothetical protein